MTVEVQRENTKKTRATVGQKGQSDIPWDWRRVTAQRFVPTKAKRKMKRIRMRKGREMGGGRGLLFLGSSNFLLLFFFSIKKAPKKRQIAFREIKKRAREERKRKRPHPSSGQDSGREKESRAGGLLNTSFRSNGGRREAEGGGRESSGHCEASSVKRSVLLS